MKELNAAKGRIVITPPIGTAISGNIRLDNKSRGIHDDLFCNILILSDNATKVCLLGFDLIYVEYEFCNDIKSRIEKETDIPAANVVMWATHTHSGPYTSLRMYQGKESSKITGYLENIAGKVVAGVVKANKEYERVILKSGKINISDLSFNRRLVKKDGSVVMNFEDFNAADIIGTTGPVDKELITLSLWDNNSKLFAILVNFSLHPAILVGYKWLISRDYINYLDEYIISKYGDHVVTLFANGAEGNINHINYRNPKKERDFAEAERIGKELGVYVSDSITDSKVIDGKIKFVSEAAVLPIRDITKEEKKWSDMVLERDKDLEEDMFDGIPDKTYAKMIKGMAARTEKECKIVLQGMAIHDFAFVTFPGEVYVEFGLKVKDLSPYKNTMIIGIANSAVGYIPKKEAFSQGGYEVKTSWSSQLVHDAGDILVEIVKKRILDNLLKQSVMVMERRASDNIYLHRDFHLCMNLLMKYIYDNYGKDALISYLTQYSRAYYKPLGEKLRTGNIDGLIEYLLNIYEKEEWPVSVILHENSVEISQDACPAISYILSKGDKPCPFYRETYNTLYTTLCEGTPFEYILEYFNDETGACKQKFIKREVKK